MFEKNNGIGELNILQNQFTAYVVTSLKRKKINYLRKKALCLDNEISLDEQEDLLALPTVQDLLDELPLLEQIENPRLQQALHKIKERDVQILIMHVLDERRFEEIGAEIGLGYKGVAAVYYRILKKLRDELGRYDK